MSDSKVYLYLWRKFRPAVVSKMAQAQAEPQTYRLSQLDFKAAGDKKMSGYTFTLEVNRGVLANNIKGNAVARDLLVILKESNAAVQLLNNNFFRFTLDKNYLLSVEVVNPEPAKDAEPQAAESQATAAVSEAGA